MTTTVDQVITIFDAVWKGDNAAKSALLNLDQYRKMSGTAAIQHMKLAESADSTSRSMMNLWNDVKSGKLTVAEAGQEFDKLNMELGKTKEEMSLLTESQQTMGEKFKGFVGTISKLGIAVAGVTIAYKALASAGQAVFSAAQEGAGIIQLTASFDRLNETVFKTPSLLNDMRAATNNTISEVDAMQSIMTLVAGSSEMLTKEFARNAPELAAIAKAANKLNPTLGDTNFMFASIARGVKRLEPRLLDNLGLNVRMAQANQRWAEANGRTVESMTAEEKVMAALNETLRVGRNLIDQVGGSTESAVDPYLQLTAAWQDYTNAVKANIGALDLGAGSVAENLSHMAEEEKAILKINQAYKAGLIDFNTRFNLLTAVNFGLMDSAEALDIVTRKQTEYDNEIQRNIDLARKLKEIGQAPQDKYPIWAYTPQYTEYNDEQERGMRLAENLRKYGQGPSATSGIIRDRNIEQQKEFVESAKEVVEQVNEMRDAILDAQAATGDYAIAAIEADKETSLFNQTIDQVGEQWVRTGGLTKDQKELLEDLEGAYDKAEQGIRDYKIGIKGVGQEQDTVNKKIETYGEQMGILAPQIEALKNVQGELVKVNQQATWNQENINQAIVDAADALGAGAGPMVRWLEYTGELNVAQAQAVLASSAMGEAIQEAAQMMLEGMDPKAIMDFIDTAKREISGFNLWIQSNPTLKRQKTMTPGETAFVDEEGYLVDIQYDVAPDAQDQLSLLEDIRSGAQAVIDVEGDVAEADLQRLIDKLDNLRRGADVPVNINDGSPNPSRPVGTPRGGPVPDAFGGPVGQGDSRWVGEKGPELFTPNVNGRIWPTGTGPNSGTTIIHNYNKEAAAVAMSMLNMRRRQGVDSLAGVI